MCREPVIESMVAGLRLLWRVEHRVAMPFSTHASRVSRRLQHSRDREFLFAQLNQLPRASDRLVGICIWNPVINSRPIGTSSSKQSNPRRRTNGRSRIETAELNPFIRHFYESRRFDMWVPVIFQIAPTQIVAKDNHDIGPIV